MAGNQREAELAEMAAYRRDWQKNFRKKTLAVLTQEYEWFRALVEKHPWRASEDNKILSDLWDAMSEHHSKLMRAAESSCRIGFFKPSWEQAQILNTWSPEFEPHLAPEGYRSVCVFCANRIGKTCVMVVDTLLWLVANNPDWTVFEPYTDHIGREVRVFPRPNWDYWRKTGKMIYDPSEPPKCECQVWQGVPNDDHWHDKVGKEYRHWIPPDMLGRRGKDPMWNIAEKWFATKWGSEIRAKTYNADVLAWAGKAVWRINLDEGINPHLYSEALTRIQAGGYFHWPYTPAEPRNLGNRTKLAHDVAKGRPEVKPPGAVKIFTKFKMADAPEWILPDEKKKDDMARYAKMGGEGSVRMNGGFFESSPVVFNNFKREAHILPWSGAELLKRFPNACLIRGFDEGTAHPTCCVWVAILQTGEYVIYREFSEANLSVSTRCEKIIMLSRNQRELTHFHTDKSLCRYRESMTGEKIRRTFADSKIFRRDPQAVQDDWTDNYRKAGLSIERATNLGPAARCDAVNDMFLPDHTRKHLAAGTEHSHNYPSHGFRLYITNDCPILVERLENYLQEQIKSGARVGEFTGQPSKEGDDEIDAMTYACASKMRWVDMATVAARAQSHVSNPMLRELHDQFLRS